MMRRRNALKIALLTTALALIALCLFALACAPSAPAGQDGAEDGAGDVAATATATATLTPAPTPALPAEVSPLVNAVMVKQATIAANDAPGAVSGPAAVSPPQDITVNIYTVVEPGNDVEQFLADNGVSVQYDNVCGEVCLMLRATVPVALLPALSVHPSVGFIDTIDKYYQQLDEHLNPIVAQYDAGLITEQEAVAQSYLPRWENRVLVIADFDSPANTRNAVRYLESNDVYLAPEYVGAMVFAAFVPFRLILPLSQQSGVVSVVGYGYGADLTDPKVQEELNDYKPPLPASSARPTPCPTASPTPTHPASSAAPVPAFDAFCAAS